MCLFLPKKNVSRIWNDYGFIYDGCRMEPVFPFIILQMIIMISYFFYRFSLIIKQKSRVYRETIFRAIYSLSEENILKRETCFLYGLNKEIIIKQKNWNGINIFLYFTVKRQPIIIIIDSSFLFQWPDFKFKIHQ